MRKILMTATALFVVAFTVSASAPDDFKIGKNLEVYFNIFRELNKYYVDQTDPDELMKKSAEGMMSSLDPYTEFMSESDMEGFEVLTTGKYGGIGSLIRKNGDWVEVAGPYKGFAADKAGLKIGDKIIAIDGKDMKGATTEKVSSLMKGEPGSAFKLTVKRVVDDSEQVIKIKRERIVISGVSYYGMINDSTGYIVHDNFSDDCSRDIRSAVMKMKEQGMKSLIFDLSGNGGGILQEAVKILDLFVPKGSEVVSIKGKSPEANSTYRTSVEPIDTTMKIVVIIGRGTASAAEIVSGALQDYDRAVLVGQRSFGKGLVQNTLPVGYNSYIKLTTAKYYIPSGRCIQAIDYSQRNPDGSVGFVADSLIGEFTTKAGRKVYDGGGIMPDVNVEPQFVSPFTIDVFTRGYIDNFALNYLKARSFPKVNSRTFKLSDDEYAEFEAFMKDKEVDFESDTESALDQLQKIAKREKYSERIEQEIENIRLKISKTKESELKEFREELSRLIEQEIVSFDNYSEGVIEHKMIYEPEIKEALRILSNASDYQAIVRTKDTQKR